MSYKLRSRKSFPPQIIQKNPPPNINTALPEDAFLAIFDRLPLVDLLTRVELVCSKWRRLQVRACRARHTLFLFLEGNSAFVSNTPLTTPSRAKLREYILHDARLEWTIKPKALSLLAWSPGSGDHCVLTLARCQWLLKRLPRITSLTILLASRSRHQSEHIHNITGQLLARWKSGLVALSSGKDSNHYCESAARETLQLLMTLNRAPCLRRLVLVTFFRLFSTEALGLPFSLYLPMLSRLEELDFSTMDSPELLLNSLAHYGQKKDSSCGLKKIALYSKGADVWVWTKEILEMYRSRLSADLRSRLVHLYNSCMVIRFQYVIFEEFLTEIHATFPNLTRLNICPGFNGSLAPLLYRLMDFTHLRILKLMLPITLPPYHLTNSTEDSPVISLPQLRQLSLELVLPANSQTLFMHHYELRLQGKDEGGFSQRFVQLFPYLEWLHCEVPTACECEEHCKSISRAEIESDHAQLRSFFTPIWRQYAAAPEIQHRLQLLGPKCQAPKLVLVHRNVKTRRVYSARNCTECDAIEDELEKIAISNCPFKNSE